MTSCPALTLLGSAGIFPWLIEARIGSTGVSAADDFRAPCRGRSGRQLDAISGAAGGRDRDQEGQGATLHEIPLGESAAGGGDASQGRIARASTAKPEDGTRGSTPRSRNLQERLQLGRNHRAGGPLGVVLKRDVRRLLVDHADTLGMQSGQGFHPLRAAIGQDGVLLLDVDACQLPALGQDPQLGLGKQVERRAAAEGRSDRPTPGGNPRAGPSRESGSGDDTAPPSTWHPARNPSANRPATKARSSNRTRDDRACS